MNAGVSESQAVLAHHSKSFALAARLLPAECRNDVAVVYAWCRLCDDAVDRAPPSEQRAALEVLRAQLDAVYLGVPQTDAVLAAFQHVVNSRQIPKLYPLELLAGMEMDATGARYEELDDLLLYCHRVAGIVGLMMCHVMGLQDPAARRNAAHLGIAMQLTNICRDVAEDWGLGRLYLPRALLLSAGATEGIPGTPLRGSAPDPRSRPVFARAVRELLELADGFYRSGDRGLPSLSFGCAVSVRAARLVYSAIGARLAKQGYDALAGRAYTSKWLKLWLVLRALATEVVLAPHRLRHRFEPVPLPPAAFPRDVLPL